MKKIVLVILILMVGCVFLTGCYALPDASLNAIDYLEKDFSINAEVNAYYDEVALTLVRADKLNQNLRTGYAKKIESFLLDKSNVLTLPDISRIAVLLGAMDEFGIINRMGLLTFFYNEDTLKNSISSLSLTLDVFFALSVLRINLPENYMNEKGEIVPVTNSYEKMLGRIFAMQEKDGSWGNVRNTVKVLKALTVAKTDTAVAEIANKGIEYLKTRQLEDGGFADVGTKFDFNLTCDTVVVFSTYRVDCEDLLKNEKSPMGVILSRQVRDDFAKGAFVNAGGNVDRMASVNGAKALISYDIYKQKLPDFYDVTKTAKYTLSLVVAIVCLAGTVALIIFANLTKKQKLGILKVNKEGLQEIENESLSVLNQKNDATENGAGQDDSPEKDDLSQEENSQGEENSTENSAIEQNSKEGSQREEKPNE